MKLRLRLNYESAAYLLVFLAGLAIRLLFLGAGPLNDAEAGWALQAAGNAGIIPATYSNPAYLVVTRLLFRLFDQTNFLARLWPALAGSLLPVLPFLFRRRLGARPALILGAALALDPGLAALSRQAGSPLPAVSFVLAAAGAWLSGWPIAAGFCLGAALLCGPVLWPGLLALGLAALAGKFTHPRPAAEETQPTADQQEAPDSPPPASRAWRKLAVSAGVVFLAAGSVLFTQPGMLAAAAGSLPEYLRTWLQGGGFPLGPFLIALPAYELLPLAFGLLGAGRSLFRRHPLDRLTAAWLATAAILACANPARQPADWAWALIPLWILAAREIDRTLTLPAEEKLPTLVQFGVGLVVLIFISISFSQLMETYQFAVADPAAAARQNIQLVVLAGAFFLLLLTSYLISWGWSAPLTLRGLTWAAGLLTAAFLAAALTRATGLDQKSNPEIWSGHAQPTQAELLHATADDLSRWNTGFPASLETVVTGPDSPALRWIFNHNRQVRYLPEEPPRSSPPLLVMPESSQPAQPAAYRGQAFTLTAATLWQEMSTLDWLEWMLYRRAPQERTRVILWARSDLFSDGKAALSAPAAP